MAGRGIPIDLVAIIIIAIATPELALRPGVGSGDIQLAFGLVFVLFAPGYALVSFLVPHSSRRERTLGNSRQRGVVFSLVERFFLAVGLSVVIVPLVGLVLYHSPLGLRPAPFLNSIAFLTVFLGVGGAIRRWQTPIDYRFYVPVADAPAYLGSWLGGAENKAEGVLTVAIVLAFVLAVLGVGFAISTAGPGETYTEFYVLAEDPISGDLVADAYSTTTALGEYSEFLVGITNKEQRTVDYFVIVELHRVDDDRVVERAELLRYQVTVAPGTTHEEPIRVAPTMAGDDLRLTLLLYPEPPPDQPATENAYRQLHLWIDVTESEPSADQF